MRHGKSNAERLLREAKIAKVATCVLRGKTDQLSIIEDTGLTPGFIRGALVLLQKRWRKSSLIDLEQAKGQKIRELDDVKAEAWGAWERSTKNRRRVTRKVTADGEEITNVLEECAGDSRFLGVIRNVVMDQAELLGLKVLKVAETDSEGNSLPAELLRRAVEVSEGVGAGVMIIDGIAINHAAAADLAASQGEVEDEDESES